MKRIKEKYMCDECEEPKESLVEFGIIDSGDGLWVCEDCIKKATKLLEEEK